MAKFLNNNIKYLRSIRGMSQQDLADKAGIDRSTISRIENNEITTTVDNAIKISEVLKIPMADLLGRDLRFDNVEIIDMDSNTIKIPVFGTIKADIPIESQTDITEYVGIPKDWTTGGKKFYGIKISGDSMFPKYDEGDIVIFEYTNDMSIVNGKDCAIMINGTESTFKKVLLNEQGIVLQSYNTAYDIMMYSKEQVKQLPIKIVGIAREKRTKLN